MATLAIAAHVLGVVTKAAGGLIGARSIGRWRSTAVGFGMIPRGEVGIVVANLGPRGGPARRGSFGAVIVAVVLTTVAAPYLLAVSVPRALKAECAPGGGPAGAQADELVGPV